MTSSPFPVPWRRTSHTYGWCFKGCWRIGSTSRRRNVSRATFLGHVQGGQVEVDPAKIRAVVEWPVPTSVKQLQRFLGFANFFRKFIKNCSIIAAPLTRLTSSKVSFRWSAGRGGLPGVERTVHISPCFSARLTPPLLETLEKRPLSTTPIHREKPPSG